MFRTPKSSIVRTAILVVLASFFIYPFVFLVGTALKSTADFSDDEVALPTQLSFANFRSAWVEAGLGPAMLHSLVAVGIGVAATVLISTLAAFWFVRHRGRGARILFYALIGTMALPPPVFIIPLFVLIADHGLSSSLVVLGLVYAGWNSSFGLYLVHTYMKGLPADVFEAAQIDGASAIQLLIRVLLPLSLPVLATLAVLSFVASWADLLISVVLIQDPGKRLLTPATALLSDQYSTNIPQQAAAVVIAILPMLAVFIAGQRWLVRGITAGVGK